MWLRDFKHTAGCDWVEWDGEEECTGVEGRDIEAQRAMWIDMEESWVKFKKDKKEFEGFRKRDATTVADGAEWTSRLRKK